MNQSCWERELAVESRVKKEANWVELGIFSDIWVTFTLSCSLDGHEMLKLQTKTLDSRDVSEMLNYT